MGRRQPRIAQRRVSEKVAVLSLSGKHTLRLLDELIRRSPGWRCRPIGRLAAVGGLDFAAFVDGLTPWVELALDKVAAQLPPEHAEMARQHAKMILEVLKVYRGSVSETYVEGKVTVTHTRSENPTGTSDDVVSRRLAG